MPNCVKEHTAGTTSQQRMLTLPRHLILFGVPCCSPINLYFVLWIFEMVEFVFVIFFSFNTKRIIDIAFENIEFPFYGD